MWHGGQAAQPLSSRPHSKRTTPCLNASRCFRSCWPVPFFAGRPRPWPLRIHPAAALAGGRRPADRAGRRQHRQLELPRLPDRRAARGALAPRRADPPQPALGTGVARAQQPAADPGRIRRCPRRAAPGQRHQQWPGVRPGALADPRVAGTTATRVGQRAGLPRRLRRPDPVQPAGQPERRLSAGRRSLVAGGAAVDTTGLVGLAPAFATGPANRAGTRPVRDGAEWQAARPRQHATVSLLRWRRDGLHPADDLSAHGGAPASGARRLSHRRQLAGGGAGNPALALAVEPSGCAPGRRHRPAPELSDPAARRAGRSAVAGGRRHPAVCGAGRRHLPRHRAADPAPGPRAAAASGPTSVSRTDRAVRPDPARRALADQHLDGHGRQPAQRLLAWRRALLWGYCGC